MTIVRGLVEICFEVQFVWLSSCLKMQKRKGKRDSHNNKSIGTSGIPWMGFWSIVRLMLIWGRI